MQLHGLLLLLYHSVQCLDQVLRKLISGADSERSRQPKEPRCRCELKDPFSWHSRESGNLPFSHSLGKHLGQGLRLEE